MTTVKRTFVWDVTPRGLLEFYQNLGGMYYLYRRKSESKQIEWNKRQSHLLTESDDIRFLWTVGKFVIWIHGVTFREILLFILTLYS
jgi:hypothetical protein